MTSLDNILSNWIGRVRGSLLDLSILYITAFHSKEVYAYSLKKVLEEKWGKDITPPLPTIYSTIDRMTKSGLIEAKNSVDGVRVKKILVITDMGWNALRRMIDELGMFLKVFEFHEKELEFSRWFSKNE